LPLTSFVDVPPALSSQSRQPAHFEATAGLYNRLSARHARMQAGFQLVGLCRHDRIVLKDFSLS
jgi:hypothetical protein